MPNDEEIVPEASAGGTEVEQTAAPPTPATEQVPKPYVVHTTVGIIGEAIYPPLTIVEIPPELEEIEGGKIDLRFFMIPTAFNESFKSRWESEDLSHGRINPIHNYGGTQREVSLSFTLAAFTVEEARSNLNICEHLARTVYGRYRTIITPASPGITERTDTIFAGHKEFIIDFGSLIRNERSFINKFSFTANIDSGVFDFFLGDDTEVTHGTKGAVLPREVNVEIGFTIVHYHLLGFGGQNRPNEPLRWAENRDRDWPHGSGPMALQTYMSSSLEVNSSALPKVTRYRDDDFDTPLRSAETVISEAETAAQIAYDTALDLEAGIAPTSFRLNPPEDYLPEEYLVSESEP